MTIKRFKTSGMWPRAPKQGVKTRGESYRVAGKTSDGVTILRGTVKPTHFTSKQIRDAILSVVSNSKG
jgi:hypothetical protein